MTDESSASLEDAAISKHAEHTNLTLLFNLEKKKRDCSIGIPKMFKQSSMEMRDSSATATLRDQFTAPLLAITLKQPATMSIHSFQENMYKANVNVLKQYQIIINMFKLFPSDITRIHASENATWNCCGYDKDL